MASWLPPRVCPERLAKFVRAGIHHACAQLALALLHNQAREAHAATAAMMRRAGRAAGTVGGDGVEVNTALLVLALTLTLSRVLSRSLTPH
eukprot:5930511-Pleurochrysis_carterae.AAC.1